MSILVHNEINISISVFALHLIYIQGISRSQLLQLEHLFSNWSDD